MPNKRSTSDVLRDSFPITELDKQQAREVIKEGMRALVELGAKKQLGAEQLRVLLDELLIDYVDYPAKRSRMKHEGASLV